MRIIERIRNMSISTINGSLSLLASAVKPIEAPVTPSLPDANAKPTTDAPPLEGKLNTFALSVYADVLESEQGLLDNNNPQDATDAQTVVDAGVSLATAQQATSAYKQAQDAAQIKPTPANITTV